MFEWQFNFQITLTDSKILWCLSKVTDEQSCHSFIIFLHTLSYTHTCGFVNVCEIDKKEMWNMHTCPWEISRGVCIWDRKIILLLTLCISQNHSHTKSGFGCVCTCTVAVQMGVCGLWRFSLLILYIYMYCKWVWW